MSSQNWTSDTDDLASVGSASNQWHDRRFLQHIGDQALLEIKKSVYDPCPPGWKVPANGTWGGFTARTSANEAAGTYTTLWDETKRGRYYYPEGYVNSENTGAIFFYALGTRSDGNASRRRTGDDGIYWSSTMHQSSVSYSLTFEELHVYPGNGYYAAYGCPVRCVHE